MSLLVAAPAQLAKRRALKTAPGDSPRIAQHPKVSPLTGDTTIDTRTLIITEAAKADLDEIYDFIALDSEIAADRFVTDLVADLHRIALLGVTGAARDWIRPGLRLHVFGKYCAYFRADKHDLTVIRIVHGARDVDTIIFDPEKNK